MAHFGRQILIRAFMLFDLGVMALAFALAAAPASHLTSLEAYGAFFSLRIKVQNIILFLALLFVWHVIFSVCGLYQSKRLGDRADEFKDVLTAC